MPLIVPKIDDRGYREILNEALARIPVHNPEYTHIAESDPGITVLSIFAFMTENLLYRSNLIPERNRLKFLKLLGITPRPATASQGVVTFANERGPLEVMTLPDNVTVLAGETGFITQNALDVLPLEGRVYIRRSLSPEERERAEKTYTQLYGTYKEEETALEFYETKPLEPPMSAASISAVNLSDGTTVDRSLWLALLTRPREENQRETILRDIAGKTLTLGLMPAIEDSKRVLQPGGPPVDQVQTPLIFHIATGKLSPERVPVYELLDVRADDNPLQNLTLIQVTLPSYDKNGYLKMGTWDGSLEPLEEGVGDFPPSLDDQEVRKRVLTWIRIRPQPVEGPPTALQARFTWLGINAARITQRIEVVAELLGGGSGEPDQTFTLVNKPVIPEAVRLTVNGEPWSVTDDLLAAPPEVPVRAPSERPGTFVPDTGDPRVFTVDRESGEIHFGDGLRGKRPPAGAQIFASYAYGGGQAGNVGIGVIKTSPQLPAGFKVSNPLPTWGGDEGESTAEAERSIPRFLQHRNRAVTIEDYRDIVKQTPAIDLGRVEVISAYHPETGASALGVITLLVIPSDPTQPEAPQPNRLFLDSVCRHIEPRRMLTSEVHVVGPSYVPISVSVGIDVVAGQDIAAVRKEVQEAIRQFLSPLKGGPEAKGWPLEKPVEDRGLLVQAARVGGVAKVRDVWMWDDTGTRVARVEIRGLKLPRLIRISVTVGDPHDLAVLAVVPAVSPKKRVAVPVLPPEC